MLSEAVNDDGSGVEYTWLADGTKMTVTPNASASGDIFAYRGSLECNITKNYVATNFSGGILLRSAADSSVGISVVHIKDHLGSVRLALLANEGLYNEYEPFGERDNTRSENAGWNAVSDRIPNRHLFHGKEIQGPALIGLLDYGARMYDPEMARWMALDPKAESRIDISPYAFCSNNPVCRIDPDGRLDDWIYSVNTGYIWRDDVVSLQTTPEGFTYVGKNDKSIIDHMGLDHTYKSIPQRRVGIGIGGGEGKTTPASTNVAVGLSQGVPTLPSSNVESNLVLEPIVTYWSNNHISWYNKTGRVFKGIRITGNIIQQNSSITATGGTMTLNIGNYTKTSILTNASGSYYRPENTNVMTSTIEVPSNQLKGNISNPSVTIKAGTLSPEVIVAPIKTTWELFNK